MRRRVFPNLIGDIAQMDERQERMERVMQILGITPEFPFTMNVNDGTRNRVRIGLIGADYGIEIVDNAGNSILLANGTIVADAIKSGTLDASLITVTNLNAGSITVGTISASIISGGTLNCSLMTVQNLSANSINVGTFASPNSRFTDESLSGVKISQGTIYGNRIVANSINADRIQAGTITADRIVAKTITADRIQDNSLGTGQIASNGVNGDRLQDATIYNGKIANATIDNAKINNVSADKLTAGTIYVGYGGRPGSINIYRNGSNGYLTWDGGNKIWSDGSQYMGFTANGERFYFYTGGTLFALFQRGAPASFYSGIDCYGGLYVQNNFRVGGTTTFQGQVSFGGQNFDGVNWASITNMNNTLLQGNTIKYWSLVYWSDESIKKNIKARKGGLDLLLRLKPKDFQYKEDKENKKHIGFSAQEFEEVLPELVDTDEKGIKGIDITQLIPLLVSAVQELKKEVELLKEVKPL